MKINKKVCAIGLGVFIIWGGLLWFKSNYATPDTAQQHTQQQLNLTPAADILKKTAEESFKYSKVQYDNARAVIVMDASTPGITNDFANAPNEQIEAFIIAMQNNCINTKESLDKIVGSEHYTYIFNIVEDDNHSEVLLTITNGDITYCAR